MKRRDEFFLRCLNAAVNLYGIVTAKEFCEVYNGYAKSHEAPISTPLAEDVAVDTARRLLQNIAEKEDDEILDVMMTVPTVTMAMTTEKITMTAMTRRRGSRFASRSFRQRNTRGRWISVSSRMPGKGRRRFSRTRA